MQFLSSKKHDPPLAATAEHKKFHDDVILTSVLRSYIWYKVIMADFPSDKYTFDCKYVSFCIKLNTLHDLELLNLSFS